MDEHAGWFRRDAAGRLLVKIHAQPGAARTEIAGIHGAALKVRISSRAVEGGANAVLVAFIAEQFGVPQRQVRLVRGGKSREKLVEVTGSSVDQASL